MLAHKESIVHGVSQYFSQEVSNVVSNGNLKFVLSAAIAAMDVNPKIADKFFCNEIVKSALHEEDGQYDIDYAEQILSKTIKECGQVTITIPAIPILLPQSQELTFRSNDVERLFRHIRNEV